MFFNRRGAKDAEKERKKKNTRKVGTSPQRGFRCFLCDEYLNVPSHTNNSALSFNGANATGSKRNNVAGRPLPRADF